MRKWKKAIGVVLLVLGLIMASLYVGLLRFNYPSKKEYPVRGIDISHYQGEINWEELSEEHVDFVIMKATEGGDWVDKRFVENWQNAQDAGYVVGVYHFFSFCKPGKLQAEHIIRTVPASPNSLAISIDLEYDNNCNGQAPKDDLLKEIQVCLELLENHYKKKPILYATPDFYEYYLGEEFLQNPSWIRSIFSAPQLENRPWTFWQYSNRGKLKGIEGYVDLNVFEGNKTAFQTLTHPTTP